MRKSCLFLISSVFASAFFANVANAEWVIRERIVNFDYEKNNTSSAAPVANIDHNSVPEIDVSYFIEKPISFELSTTASRQSATSSFNSSNLGDVWLIPANLTAQYHFFADQPLKPYIGAGINYTWFITTGSSGGNNVTYDDSVGIVGQVGTDLQITKSWLLNFDVKKIYMRPKVSINGSPKTEDKIDPWVFGVGVGYKF